MEKRILLEMESKIIGLGEVELKTMNVNKHQQISYAVFENEIQLPILDITHPLFNASIDEQAYHLSCLKSARSIESLKKMPGFIQNIFVKMSNVDNSYLSGMRTLLYKLGPNFAKRCIDVLKQPGERFHGMDITLNIFHYDWSQPEALLKISLERSDWIQLCSSEGGLFEYGSNLDIIENLNHFFKNSPEDARVTGSIIFDRAYVNPGYLGFTELIGVKIRYLGLEGLQRILAQTSWVLEESHEIDTIYILFSLKKA